VRGVLRQENAVLKKYIAAIAPGPLTASVSARAMRATLGLAQVAGDVVQAVEPRLPGSDSSIFSRYFAENGCLLSETEEFIDLHGNYNFQTMLQYRLAASDSSTEPVSDSSILLETASTPERWGVGAEYTTDSEA
jgi:hypothetical protein